MQFKVEYISRPKPSPFVMVRHLKAGSFEFGPNPALDGILIAEWASPPRSIALVAFLISQFFLQPILRADLAKLRARQVVRLTS